jgi:hypothetical protein
VISYDELARHAYAAYCKAVGGKSCAGIDLPTYDSLTADRQRAWQAVAMHTVAEVAALR